MQRATAFTNNLMSGIMAAILLALAVGYGAAILLFAATAMSMILSAPAMMLLTLVVVGIILTIRGIARTVSGHPHSNSR